MSRAKLAWILPWREKVGVSPIRLDLIYRTSQKGIPSSVTVVTLLCVSCSIVVRQLLYYCVTVVTQVGLPVTRWFYKLTMIPREISAVPGKPKKQAGAKGC